MLTDFCCCFKNLSSEPADRDPVVLVSGIGGSILNSKRKKFGFQTRVWVRILFSDLEFKKKVWSVYNPDTGYTESLDDSTELVVPQDDYGLYAIDILDPSLEEFLQFGVNQQPFLCGPSFTVLDRLVLMNLQFEVIGVARVLARLRFVKCLHLSDVYHFHDMIDMLVGCGYKKGKTLFGYGYDFRQSNRIDTLMDGLKEKLETAYKASGGRKINLISHSMGGLLVLCFIALHGDIFTKYVNKWITIATPFQGAPGCINDTLLTGLQFVDGFESFFFVSRWSMHQLLVECPSIYEMLPNSNFQWKKEPKIKVWRKKLKDGETSVELETYGGNECVAVFEEALKNNELNYDGKKVALPFNHKILEWANGTREVLDKVKLPKGVSFYNIYGNSCDTPFDVCYGTESSPIDESSEICHTLPEYSYADGDGTVPSESAMADGFDAVERVGVSGSHRGLLKDKKVFELIQNWLEVPEKSKVQHVVRKTSKVVDAYSVSPI